MSELSQLFGLSPVQLPDGSLRIFDYTDPEEIKPINSKDQKVLLAVEILDKIGEGTIAVLSEEMGLTYEYCQDIMLRAIRQKKVDRRKSKYAMVYFLPKECND